jgi:hypothetical protein
MYVSLGLNARYVTEKNYSSAVVNLDLQTVLVYVHGSGEDVILMGDNKIDVVRFKFRNNGSGLRA